jgi:hypothetical protein
MNLLRLGQRMSAWPDPEAQIVNGPVRLLGQSGRARSACQPTQLTRS